MSTADESLHPSPPARTPWLIAGALTLGAAGLAVLLWVPDPLALAADAFARLQSAPPAIFFGAMAIACLFPVPVSLFYVASAPLYGAPTALAWIAVALVVNVSLSHLAAESLLRPWIVRFVESRGFTVPRFDARRDEALLIVLVRITPGLPFFAQNLLLGLAGVDLRRSLALSVPIQMIFATGFVLLGQSAFDGSLGLAMLGFGVIGSATIAARFVHQRLRAAAD